jgi:hypothetical protein
LQMKSKRLQANAAYMRYYRSIQSPLLNTFPDRQMFRIPLEFLH